MMIKGGTPSSRTLASLPALPPTSSEEGGGGLHLLQAPPC